MSSKNKEKMGKGELEATQTSKKFKSKLLLFFLFLIVCFLGYLYFKKEIMFKKIEKDNIYAQKIISKTTDFKILEKTSIHKKINLRILTIERLSQLPITKETISLIFKIIDNEILDKEKDGVSLTLLEKAFNTINDKSAIPQLKKYLYNPYTDIYSAVALHRLGDTSGSEKIFQLLKSNLVTEKIKACHALQKIPLPQSIPEIIKFKKIPSTELYIEAVKTLGKIGTEEALQSMLIFYTNSTKSVILEELKAIKYEKLEPILIKNLKSKNVQTVSIIIEVLSEIGKKTALEGLFTEFSYFDKNQKKLALQTIAKLADETNIPKIEKLLKKEKDRNIQNEISKILKQLHQKKILTLTKKTLPPTPLTTLQPSVPQPITPLKQKEYIYKGLSFRDPFLVPKTKSAAHLTAEIEPEIPDIDALIIKGILKDKTEQIVLFSSYSGGYILRGEKFYDLKNNLIKGIKGKIEKDKVVLTTEKNEIKEFELKTTPK